MRAFLCVLAVVALCVASGARASVSADWVEPTYATDAADVDGAMALLEVEQLPRPMFGLANIGYVSTSVPFDNPATSFERVPTIPNAPDCTVRPQTIVEIKRMRRSAARIAQMIQTEVVIMEKRKTYVEQMTSYLNDRIRELNKVKSELEQENKWIEVSNQRIAELAEKEKLIKMQDILTCLNDAANRDEGAKQAKERQVADLRAKTNALINSIKGIKANIVNINGGRVATAPTTSVVRSTSPAVTSVASTASSVTAAPAAGAEEAPQTI